MKVVKLKIVEHKIKVMWKCPLCDKTNVEYNYDDSREEVLHCYGCGAQFKGEIEKEEKK